MRNRHTFIIGSPLYCPRQTGKTTALIALARELTGQSRYAAVRFSCEGARAAGDDFDAATLGILQWIREAAETSLSAELWPPPWPEAPPAARLGTALRAWAEVCPRPLVLFFDEIDALQGQTLISVLSQLRNGFTDRPAEFPASVALCGLRDVRDCHPRNRFAIPRVPGAASGGDSSRLGTSSPFNIKVESLRLGDFTLEDVSTLYGQHTTETGQQFAPGAVEHAYELTGGQPWLVNALAREVIEKIQVPPTEAVTIEHLEKAKERLILARATRLDSLAARLAEPRVQRILGPVIAGDLLTLDPYNDDLSYVRDLGLIARKAPVRVANPIYREVIARVLASSIEESVTANPRSFIRPDNSFNFPKMLDEFADWWIEHGEFLTKSGYYHEVAPQLILMGYLQRVVNGGGYIAREYAVGTGRIDLQIRWPYQTPDGTHHTQREAIEIKTWRPGGSNPLPQGLKQLDRYLDRLQLDTGTLAIFDQRPRARPIDKRTKITTTTSPAGRTITLLNG